jgi:predicted amidohydrolase
VQLESAGNVAANRAAAAGAVRAAAAAGVKLVVLPEKWPLLTGDVATVESAETLEGPSMSLCSELASDLGIDLVAGSFAELREGHDHLSNTSVHFGPDGVAKAVYRKIHLFDARVGGREYRESDVFEPGQRPVLSTLADGTVIGLAICFDLRFPRLFAALAEAGAEVICLPAAFTRETTEAHWELLLRARAVETGCHVVAANQSGADGAGRPAGGCSAVVAPDGTVLSMLQASGVGAATAELDRVLRDDVRMAMPPRARVIDKIASSCLKDK